MTGVIEPGATLGVLGAGQLGRMFAIAARRMGYRVHVLSPDDDTPAGQVADVEVRAAYDDLDAVARFARNVDVVTFEFENVSADAAAMAERHAPVRPAGRVLHTTQNRLREKTALANAGIPVTRFAAVRTGGDLAIAVASLGLPAVLKTSDWGYDGKGQRILRTPADVTDAAGKLDGREHVLEAFVDFDCEVSVVVARGLDGDAVTYGPLHNEHRNHILDVTTYPAPVSPQIASDAIEMARAVCQTLEVVGVLCVEFFVARDGRLLVNELAPRPHNSGHLTIDACVTCQFAQQVRTICGLPLGSPRWHSPAAMVNLLGDVWLQGAPQWSRPLAQESVMLHLYGKLEPRAGRKMGHITALGATAEMARERAMAARASLHG